MAAPLDPRRIGASTKDGRAYHYHPEAIEAELDRLSEFTNWLCLAFGGGVGLLIAAISMWLHS